jgi:hypothetical protein
MESALHEHVASLEFNNIDQLHEDVTRLSRIVLADAHHFNVLSREDAIVAAVSTWLTGQSEDVVVGWNGADVRTGRTGVSEPSMPTIAASSIGVTPGNRWRRRRQCGCPPLP